MQNGLEQELRDRIRELETENSVLRDKLDLIYSIVAPEDEEEAELVQIRNVN